MLLFAILLLAHVSQATDEPRYEKLSNGVRYCCVERPRVGVVSVQTWIRAGSICDAPNRAGMAALAGELLRRRGGAAARLDALGVSSRAGVYEEAMYFETLIPSEGDDPPDGGFLDQVLAIHASRLKIFKPSRTEIDRALTNLAVTDESRPGRARREMRAALFAKHPYANPPEFVVAGLKDATPGEVAEYFERWVAPTACFVLVAGDIPAQRASQLVRRHFGTIGWREAARRSDFDNPPPGDLRLPAIRESGSAIAWLVPSFGHVEATAVDAALWQLQRALVREGLPITVSAPVTAKRAGMRVVQTRPDRAEPSVEGDFQARVSAALQKIATEPLAEEELNLLRAQLAARAAAARLDFRSRALRLGMAEMFGGDLLLDEYIAARPARLTVGDVQLGASILLDARSVVRGPPAATRAVDEGPGLPAPLDPVLRERDLPEPSRVIPVAAAALPGLIDHFGAVDDRAGARVRRVVIPDMPRLVIRVVGAAPARIPPGLDAARFLELCEYRGIDRTLRDDGALYAGPMDECGLLTEIAGLDFAAIESASSKSRAARIAIVTGTAATDCGTGLAATAGPAPPTSAPAAPAAAGELRMLRGVETPFARIRVTFQPVDQSTMQRAFSAAVLNGGCFGDFAAVVGSGPVTGEVPNSGVGQNRGAPLPIEQARELIKRARLAATNPDAVSDDLERAVARGRVAARLVLSDPAALAEALTVTADPWNTEMLGAGSPQQVFRAAIARMSPTIIVDGPAELLAWIE